MVLAIGWNLPAEAQVARTSGHIDIAARTLPEAIAELAREAHVSIGSDSPLPRQRTNRVIGAATVADALARLLHGSGLVARQVGPTAWRIERQATPAPAPPQPISAPTIAPVEPPPEPIIVSASKRRIALADAPFSVSVIELDSGQDQQPALGSAWAAARADGIAVAGQGAGRNRMFLRGVADSPFNGDSQSTVAVVLDDARLTYAAPDPDIRLIDVERVEVLKGPQGALYGSGALGGIYRIVTRQPDTSRSTFVASTQGSALQHGGTGVAGSATANVPLVADLAALRLTAYAAKDGGWVDTGNRADSNSATALGLRVALGIYAGPWRIDARGFGQWLNSADSAYVYRPGSRTRPAQVAEPHDNDLRHASLHLHRSGPVDVVLSSGITWHEVRDRFDATRGAASLGLADPQVLDDGRSYRTWDSELRASGSLPRLDWLIGLSHVEARQRSLRELGSASGATLALTNTRHIAADSALFGEGTLALGRQFQLMLGARLFRNHAEEQWLLPQSASSSDRTKTGVTPAAALSWKPRDGRLIYLRYGSAFRQGGAQLGNGGAVDELASDELATLEAGWREPFAGGSLNASLFASQWEDVQSDILIAPATPSTINAGDARVIGAELAWTGPIARGWEAEGGAMWQSSLLIRNASGIPLDDRRLPLVPRYTLRGRITHQFALGSFGGNMGLDLRYVGPGRFSFDPQLDVPVGDYLESTVEAQLRKGDWEVALGVTNLAGTRADTMPYGNPLRLGVARQYTPAIPRSAVLKITWRH